MASAEIRPLASLTQYEMIIYWREEDQPFIAEAPELDDCNSFQEAVKNAEQVITEWIETAEELGRFISEPKKELLYA